MFFQQSKFKVVKASSLLKVAQVFVLKARAHEVQCWCTLPYNSSGATSPFPMPGILLKAVIEVNYGDQHLLLHFDFQSLCLSHLVDFEKVRN